MKTGAELIAEERRRQIEEEGWTAEHDDEHKQREMAAAAICYIWGMKYVVGEYLWPWDDEWWKPSGQIRNLVKAGALMAAEIDRLQRKEEGEG